MTVKRLHNLLVSGLLLVETDSIFFFAYYLYKILNSALFFFFFSFFSLFYASPRICWPVLCCLLSNTYSLSSCALPHVPVFTFTGRFSPVRDDVNQALLAALSISPICALPLSFLCRNDR